MKKALTIFVFLTIAITSAIASDDLRRKAEQNPLDAAWLILSKDHRSESSERLASDLAEAGRYDDALKVIELTDRDSPDILCYANTASKLIAAGKPEKARLFINQALGQIESDKDEALWYGIEKLAEAMIAIDSKYDVLTLAAKSDRPERSAIKIAHALLEANRPADAVRVVTSITEIEETGSRAEVIEILALAGETDRASKDLAAFENTELFGTPEVSYKFALPTLIRANLVLGRSDYAIGLWNQYGERDDANEWKELISSLIRFGQPEKAHFYLKIFRQDEVYKDQSNIFLVAHYLLLGDLATAEKIARDPSRANDDYWQQESLMAIADYFLNKGDRERAKSILDFAFGRASRVVFAHEVMQSNGASSGTRKRRYLWNIFNRRMKLGQYNEALATVRAIGSEHRIAKEFVAETLFAFLKSRAKSLSKTERDGLLAEMTKSVSVGNEDYDIPRVKLFAAEIYAIVGERKRSVDLLADIIPLGNESCCYEFGFLVDTGKVFETYKLKANAKLKTALLNLIEE